MKLANNKVQETVKKLTVASAFSNNDSDDEVEEMPAECRMRMRNIGRFVYTINSFIPLPFNNSSFLIDLETHQHHRDQIHLAKQNKAFAMQRKYLKKLYASIPLNNKNEKNKIKEK